ncbi:hypothetical protein [Inquilinus sp. OTU3971]|uniref:hypothetical protein n=1 Tax=Inquilinus sp. OTU3971 TaxID=3043855 RepID=UPI00313B9EE1
MIGSWTCARMLSCAVVCLSLLAAGGMSPVAAQMGAGENMLTTVTATVQSVDLENRMVTLKDSDGRVATLHVAPEVVNLPQVKPGDRVTVSRYEAVAIDVSKAAAGAVPMVTQSTTVARAEEGELPAGQASRITNITAQLVGLNAAEHKVVFIGPAGGVRTVYVKRPKLQQMLHELQVGDMVQISFAEAEAASVTPVE